MLDINWQPARREVRQFAAIWFPLFWGLVGAWAARRWGWSAGGAIWTAGGLLCLAAWCSEPLGRRLLVGWMCAAFPVGWVMSHVLMAVIYYGLITPLGLVMRATGRDVLGLKFDRSATTYWTPHRPAQSPRRYYQQF